jgi:3-phytase
MKHAVIAILLAATGAIAIGETTGIPDDTSIPVVRERFVTSLEPEANIDSVAVSPASGGEPALLFATAKATDVIKVFDASSGKELRELGSTSISPEQYQRPNGVAVTDDLLIVVERDNRRISIRSIPDYRVLATFGDDVLRKPYGLWVHQLTENRFRLFVTDAYEMADESVPPNGELDERVKQWVFIVNRDSNGAPVAIDSRFEKSFGDTTVAGALRVVESIFGDPLHNRLLIAEEDESPETGLMIKVYDLAGRFTGETIGKGVFEAQAEGIALYACEDGSGYWLSTDQAKNRTVYHLFDRKTLQHVGAFTGEVTANTDGVWLATGGIPGFESGAFLAVHDDQAVSAFDWMDIAGALELTSCR